MALKEVVPGLLGSYRAGGNDEKRRSRLAGIERLKQATIDERMRAASDQRRIAPDLLKGGLRSQNPGLSKEEVEFKAEEILFGRAVGQDMHDRRR
jgi:hypothetical protein